ncbi:HNH endonuclease signature motif containing protein [Enterococcus durans]|uniref:HNH endonuclease signature motif containing protein n=1 Tax=Enterococcus durans TaxID=53345 RepID=UPI00071C0367|nr:HNH endonuclease signature motif containing protein [Enterococcus durans]KST46392.1 hypothetical protein AOY33_03510 [Enterococcus durans]
MENIIYKNGYAYYDGKKFRKDKQKGYYLSTSKIGNTRIRLHVYVWEKFNGKVPKGYQIHHRDEDKDHNDISNLMCMTKSEHLAWHAKHDRERMLPVWRNSLDKARIEASKWHGSPEGKRLHSEIAKGKKHKKVYMHNCKNCGKTFRSSLERTEFCSPKCQSGYRRKSGIDNEIRTCVICGKEFTANKYTKAAVCSDYCRKKRQLIRNSKTKRGTSRLITGRYIGSFSFYGKKYHTTTYEKEEDAYEANQKNIEKFLKSLE